MSGVAAWACALGCSGYNEKTADILRSFKDAKDAWGNSILDHTVMPYLTEVGDPSHARGRKASLIFGGMLRNADPLAVLPAETEKSDRKGAAPSEGLWEQPPA